MTMRSYSVKIEFDFGVFVQFFVISSPQKRSICRSCLETVTKVYLGETVAGTCLHYDYSYRLILSQLDHVL